MRKPTFSQRNLNFAKHAQIVFTDSHWQQFSLATCEFVRNSEKCLCVLFKDRSVERRQRGVQNEKLVREMSAKTLYTLFVFRIIFICSSIFCGCSRIVSRVLNTIHEKPVSRTMRNAAKNPLHTSRVLHFVSVSWLFRNRCVAGLMSCRYVKQDVQFL